MEQIALLGDIGRDIGGVGHRIFVADDGREARIRSGDKRRQESWPGTIGKNVKGET